MDLSGNVSFIILYMLLGYFSHSLHFSSHETQNNAASNIQMQASLWEIGLHIPNLFLKHQFYFRF